MATLPEITAAMVSQLESAIQPATIFDLHFEPRYFPIAEMPAIEVFPGDPTGLEEGLAGFGSHSFYGAVPITVRVRVGLADLEAGQELLYAMMDDEDQLSIIGALGADTTLGGVVDDLTWGHGYPWTGVVSYLDANGDGTMAGAELRLVVVKTQS